MKSIFNPRKILQNIFYVSSVYIYMKKRKLITIFQIWNLRRHKANNMKFHLTRCPEKIYKFLKKLLKMLILTILDSFHPFH